jgi:adenylate kinase
MHAIVVSLLAFGCMFNCCAIAFLVLERRKRDLQRKTFQKSLEQIYYHLQRARRGSIARAVKKPIASEGSVKS